MSRSPSRRLNLSWPLPQAPNLAVVEELLVEILAASLGYLFELLVVRLIRQVLPAQ
jgi:hypothetical protein